MCFSATASFGAGIVLTVLGAITIKKVQHPSQIMFASIPLIFAVQQIAEGVLWLTLPDPRYAKTQISFTYMFLIFAQVVWPIWIPVSILLLEKLTFRKKIQSILVAVGLLVGIYLICCLLMFTVRANIVGYHIRYKVDFPPALRMYGIVLYALASILPSFFSTVKRMWMLGVTILVSYIISAIFYEHYVLSVWCFFASVISISVYVIMMEIAKGRSRDDLTPGSLHKKTSLV